MRLNTTIDQIVGLKVKKKTLDFEERNEFIEHFLILALEEDDTINPFFRALAEDIAVLHSYFEFELADGSMYEVDLLQDQYSTDDLYDLAYMFDIYDGYDVNYRQIGDILSDLDMFIENNKKTSESKYDALLDKLFEVLDKYEKFSEVDIDKFVKSMSVLSKKLGSVSNEELVKVIIETMKDDRPIEEEDIVEATKSVKKKEDLN